MVYKVLMLILYLEVNLMLYRLEYVCKRFCKDEHIQRYVLISFHNWSFYLLVLAEDPFTLADGIIRFGSVVVLFLMVTIVKFFSSKAQYRFVLAVWKVLVFANICVNASYWLVWRNRNANDTS